MNVYSNSDFTTILMKHSFTNAKDIDIKWNADFAKMVFTIRVDFINTTLLLSIFDGLEHRDERFEKTKIIGAIAITNWFKVRLELPSGTAFNVRAYQPFSMPKTRIEPPELELFEIPKFTSIEMIK